MKARVALGLNDVKPSWVIELHWPIHQIGLVNMGLPLVDSGHMEDAVAVAAELRRWKLLLGWHSLPVSGAIGISVSAVATLQGSRGFREASEGRTVRPTSSRFVAPARSLWMRSSPHPRPEAE